MEEVQKQQAVEAEISPEVSQSIEDTASVQDTGQLLQQGQDELLTIAAQIGEEPAQLVKRQDVTQVLERMKEGVTVTLHISRPRFWSKLTLEDLGLAVDGEATTSAEANSIMNDYFELGRRTLVPKEYQDKLAKVEANARYCLSKYSFKSHWGAFIPLTLYEKWKDENTEHEQAFWALKEEIVSNYAAICTQVVEASRPLAEDAWMRVTLGKSILPQRHDQLTTVILEEVVNRLRVGQGKETFIANYLDCIRRAIPDPETVANGFSFEYERGVIQLPSLLAQDMENAERIYRERTLRDAQVQSELAALEDRRRLEWQKLNAQQRIEQDLAYAKLQAERERQRLQIEMERDVLGDARRQKQRLVKEFYDGIVQQINTLVFEVSSNVLESLEEHDGQLRGPVSIQLRNLVAQLEKLNFVEDEQIEQQIERLQKVLPTQADSDAAAKGTAKIETKRISAVVRQLHRESEQILVDLGVTPKVRKKRQAPAGGEDGLIDLGTRRRTRSGTTLTLQGEEQSQRRHARRTES